MPTHEKRKFIRQDSLHLLDFIVIDRQGRQGTYSMGRTIDVSESGIKLETTQPLEEKDTLMLTLGLEDNLIDIMGIVTHCNPRDGRYLSGIKFRKMSLADRTIFKKYSDAFRKRKKQLQGEQESPS